MTQDKVTVTQADIFTQLCGMSDSEFADVAGGEWGEDFKSAIIGEMVRLQDACTAAESEARKREAVLVEALERAAGYLHWAGSATPGIAHPEGKALVLQWEAQVRAALAAHRAEGEG